MKVCRLALVVAMALATSALAKEQTFDLKKLRALRFEVASSTDLAGIGKDLKVVVMHLPLEEEFAKVLGPITRMFILEGERILFDSFEWDDVSDAVEPGPNTRTFFKLNWSVIKPSKSAKQAFLVITGVIPQQEPGEAIKTANRILVLRYSTETGFEDVVDATSARPAVISGTEIKIPLQ